MKESLPAYLIANFGGPRTLAEVKPFLKELLCDRDMIRTKWPKFVHHFLFSRIAKKRSKTVREDYRQIGGGSPIYQDTETLAKSLSQKLNAPVLTFHRYLTATHKTSIQEMLKVGSIKVLPMFPQFSYATTGSIARFLSFLAPGKLQWIRSFASHPAFIQAYARRVTEFLAQNNLLQEEVFLLFSAHGLPKTFIETGDPYETECNLSFGEILKKLPKAKGALCYQSKFGRGEWLKPYTNEFCSSFDPMGRRHVVLVPISFTSDHIETLFEIEQLYLPILRNRNLNAYRCPALNLEPYWISALAEIALEKTCCNTHNLIYK